MSHLYETDVVEWSEHQAELLRRHVTGQPGNEAPDWLNIIEELADVGRSQIRSVQSLLMRALLHDLKVLAWPHSLYVPHWRAEARAFRADARRSFTPSMRQRIDIPGLLSDATRALPASVDGYPPAMTGLVLAKLAQPRDIDEALTDRPDDTEGDKS